MSEESNGVTNFLLLAILFVLLFGAGAFLTGLAWVAGIGAVLGIVVIIGVVAASILRTLATGAIHGATSFNEWGPKVPAAIGSFFRGWLYWIGSPVLAPLGHWQKLNQDRAAGQHVGIISASFSLAWVFVLSLFFCWVAVTVPLLIVAVTVLNLI